MRYFTFTQNIDKPNRGSDFHCVHQFVYVQLFYRSISTIHFWSNNFLVPFDSFSHVKWLTQPSFIGSLNSVWKIEFHFAFWIFLFNSVIFIILFIFAFFCIKESHRNSVRAWWRSIFDSRQKEWIEFCIFFVWSLYFRFWNLLIWK